MFIHYGDMPGFSNLFLDYINEFENVKDFYRWNVHSPEDHINILKNITPKDAALRQELSRIVSKQYSNFTPSRRTLNNIELLKSEKTFAIVTGQQLGIFGGPMYTLYKTITAIKLAANLKEIYEGYNFVPVFWLESEDHDFDEVSSTTILGKENQLIDLQYSDGQGEDVNRGPVSRNLFNDNLEQVIQNLTENLRDTDFKKPVLEYIKNIYKKNKSFLTSFTELMFGLFDEYGLVLIDPSDAGVKNLLKPVFKKELLDFRDHSNILVERSAVLDDVYHAQVKVKPVNLFLIDENERLLIEPLENDFRLKGKRKRFTLDELMNMLENSPEHFSPNVLLRPICQDYLLPTAYYVAGPGEVSYFAQLMPLYNIFNITPPIIYPRASATIIEKGVKNIFDKLSLTFTDFLIEENSVLNKIINSISEIKVDDLFAAAVKESELIFDNLKPHLYNIDKTLLDLNTKSRDRVFQVLEQLKNKVSEAEKKKHEVVLRQISKVSNILYPNENLQEREINFIYFVNKYGFDFLKDIYDSLTINKFEHQIIELE